MNQDHNSMCMCETYVTEEELKYITLRSRQLKTQKQEQKQVKEIVPDAGWVTVTKRQKKEAKK